MLIAFTIRCDTRSPMSTRSESRGDCLIVIITAYLLTTMSERVDREQISNRLSIFLSTTRLLSLEITLESTLQSIPISFCLDGTSIGR